MMGHVKIVHVQALKVLHPFGVEWLSSKNQSVSYLQNISPSFLFVFYQLLRYFKKHQDFKKNLRSKFINQMSSILEKKA